MTSREAFETWARKDGTWEVVRDDDSATDITSYTDFNLALAWRTWQATRSAATTGMPAGWVAVPVEPTEAMLNAVHESAYVVRALAWREAETARYAALLVAAPKFPQEQGS